VKGLTSDWWTVNVKGLTSDWWTVNVKGLTSDWWTVNVKGLTSDDCTLLFKTQFVFTIMFMIDQITSLYLF